MIFLILISVQLHVYHGLDTFYPDGNCPDAPEGSSILWPSVSEYQKLLAGNLQSQQIHSPAPYWIYWDIFFSVELFFDNLLRLKDFSPADDPGAKPQRLNYLLGRKGTKSSSNITDLKYLPPGGRGGSRNRVRMKCAPTTATVVCRECWSCSQQSSRSRRWSWGPSKGTESWTRCWTLQWWPTQPCDRCNLNLKQRGYFTMNCVRDDLWVRKEW